MCIKEFCLCEDLILVKQISNSQSCEHILGCANAKQRTCFKKFLDLLQEALVCQTLAQTLFIFKLYFNLNINRRMMIDGHQKQKNSFKPFRLPTLSKLRKPLKGDFNHQKTLDHHLCYCSAMLWPPRWLDIFKWPWSNQEIDLIVEVSTCTSESL